MNLPLLAITVGDPTGVGPECIVGAWRDPRVHACCRPFVVGHPRLLARAAEVWARATDTRTASIDAITSPADALPCPDRIPCFPAIAGDSLSAPRGRVDARGGQAAYDALAAAADMALAGDVDGIVTAPLHKVALWLAGHHYPGHTELLAERCGVDEFAMMLYLPPGEPLAGAAGLGVVHVTLHMSLRAALDTLSTSGVLEKIRLADRAMRRLGCGRPRIGVCALNPHAGECGLFGDEEPRIIAPAVGAAQAEDIDVVGPEPADTLMVRARDGEFDAVVAMYHDQGHIALKLLGMHRAVNVTLGLPIVRTSVAHGVAFDLAWQGRANPNSMVEAICVAARLAKHRGATRE